MLPQFNACLGKNRNDLCGFSPADIFGDNHTVVVVINILHLVREFG